MPPLASTPKTPKQDQIQVQIRFRLRIPGAENEGSTVERSDPDQERPIARFIGRIGGSFRDLIRILPAPTAAWSGRRERIGAVIESHSRARQLLPLKEAHRRADVGTLRRVNA